MPSATPSSAAQRFFASASVGGRDRHLLQLELILVQILGAVLVEGVALQPRAERQMRRQCAGLELGALRHVDLEGGLRLAGAAQPPVDRRGRDARPSVRRSPPPCPDPTSRMRDALTPAGASTSSICPDLPVKRLTLSARLSAPPVALSAFCAAGVSAPPSSAPTIQAPDVHRMRRGKGQLHRFSPEIVLVT